MNLLYFRRKLLNKLALTAAVGAMAFGLFWLGWILSTLISHSFSYFSTAVFTEMTPPPGGKGGLLNAIYGSLLLTTLATAIGTPIGILAGTYLSEFGQKSFVASVVRFINSILLSAPSVGFGFGSDFDSGRGE
jgi:phosphate transport system permease protein